MTSFILYFLGTTTDGEFCSLRTRDETRALHLWQLIHDARQIVQKMSKKRYLKCFLLTTVSVFGSFSLVVGASHTSHCV